MNIEETAQAYVPPQTKNIADLDIVQTDMEVLHKVVSEGTEDEFSYDYLLVKGVEYRVPKSVLKQLKVHLESNPGLSAFQVKKTGTGLSTEYTVLPRM